VGSLIKNRARLRIRDHGELRQRTALGTFKNMNGHARHTLSLPSPRLSVQAWYSDEARESVLHRPGISSTMPRELYELYARHMVGPSALLRRKRKSTKLAQVFPNLTRLLPRPQELGGWGSVYDRPLEFPTNSRNSVRCIGAGFTGLTAQEKLVFAWGTRLPWQLLCGRVTPEVKIQKYPRKLFTAA
jgi:hypothetical protein